VKGWRVDADIRRAATPPGSLYTDRGVFEAMRERVLAPAWHMVPTLGGAEAGEVSPFDLAGGALDTPLVMVRGQDGVARCLSNVCTHRANVIVSAPGCVKSLRCGYHGRRFSLDGRFAFMPELEGALDFPSRADDLSTLPLETLGPIAFTSLRPARAFGEIVEPLRDRLGFAPWGALVRASERVYDVAAHWALYVENYLEGFHVPFVHPGLAETLDYQSYRTELFPWCSLQVGVGKGDDSVFELPAAHPDAGQRVAGYYFFVFPTTMVNVYPWGVSMNAVEPVAIDRTRVRFVSWVWDAALAGRGAGGDLDTVELEDEAVVETVQRGVRSPLYAGGRYSPAREQAVHHFHQLLHAALGG